MTLALVIPFRGAHHGANPLWLEHLARIVARLTHLQEHDRPDHVVVGHMPLRHVDQKRLEAALAQGVRKHPLGRWTKLPLEFGFHETKEPWNPAFARNVGAYRALQLGAEQLVFCDADTLPAPGAFAEARAAISPTIAMTQRPWLVGPNAARMLVVDTLWPDLPTPKLEDNHNVVVALGAWFGVHAEVFKRCNGYDQALPRGEDEDLADRVKRAGAEIRVYDTLCVHYGRITDACEDPRLPAIKAILERRARENVIRVPELVDVAGVGTTAGSTASSSAR